MSINSLTPSQLRQAANLKEKIAALEKQLGQLLGSASTAVATVKPAKKKGKISAAGKARISAAAKLRWAKVNAAKAKALQAAVKTAVVKPAKKKFVMSAAAKAKLSALAKARWAKIKAAKK
jgi:hypothetical protein